MKKCFKVSLHASLNYGETYTIQPTPNLSASMPNFGEKNMTSVGFAGANMEMMYVTCGDKIYRRKVQANGNRFFLPPTKAPAPAKKK